MSAEKPLVSIVIVSYNTREMTLECLRVLYADLRASHLDSTSEVWVVDNASRDGSVAAIRAAFPLVNVMASDRNIGFGAANNRALEQASGEFLLLLNSDAFPEPGAIGALARYLREHREVGVVGPRLLNRDGSLQESCFRFPSPTQKWVENLWISAVLKNHPVLGDYRRWAHDAERQVDFVSGACMMVRREVYDQVGGFDERFFMYSEETDWQRRIRDNGWQVAFTPSAQVTHYGGSSGATVKAQINNYFFDSMDFYTWKHHGLRGLVSLRLAMTIGCFLRTIGWTLAMMLPHRRDVALSKARLYSWLFVREMTHWNLQLQERKSRNTHSSLRARAPIQEYGK
jgi:GT2 family glycosyltransferase